MPTPLVAHTGLVSSAATTTTTSGINTTGANLLVAAVAAILSSTANVTDSKGNTWTPLTAYKNSNNGGVQLFYCKNPTVGSGHTFTVDKGTNDAASFAVAAYNGIDIVSPFDVQNGAHNDSATTLQPGSVTPSQNNSLVITALKGYSPSAGSTVNSSFSVTDATIDGGKLSIALAWKLQTTAAAENPTWTDGYGSTYFVASAIAVFKPAPPPPPPPPITYGPGYITVDTLDPAESFEVLQLCTDTKDATESITFALFESQQGEGGFETSTLYGPATGRKRWKIGFPFLNNASADKTVTASDGGLMNAATYLWDLYCRSCRTGKPFVITSPRNGQFYLVKFANGSLDYNRFVTQLFASTVELKQVRRAGVVVFDPSKLRGLTAWWRADQFTGPTITNLGDGGDIDATAVTDDGDEQNGMATLRLDGATSFLSSDSGLQVYDALMVLKYQGLTFDNDAPLLGDNTDSVQALAGDTGETKLLDLSFGDDTYRYWKNSVQYLEADQQAPMDQFGLIHARWPAGLALDNQILIGKYGTDFAEIDIAEIMLFSQLNPESDMTELEEYLQDFWDI